MTHPIDTAYVDIVSEKRSREKFQRDIDKAMDNVTKKIEQELKEIEKSFDDTFTEIDKYFAAMSAKAEQKFLELEKASKTSLENIEAEFEETTTVISRQFDQIGDDADRSFKRARSRFFEPFQRGLSAIGATVGELGKAMFQLVSGVGGAVGSNPLLALILVLAPAVIALSAALSQLIGLVGLLPGAFSILIAAILPVVLAFQNFGDAISAVAGGDIDAMNEALKKLAPSAAAVALEFGRVLPLLREFQKSIQQAFFAPLIGDLTRFATITLPGIRDGMSRVAGAVGGLVHSFAVWASQTATVTKFQEVFNSTARIIQTLTRPLTAVADALLRVTVHSLPFIERLNTAFAGLLTRFSNFLNTSIDDGSFDKFLEDALKTVKELGALVSSIGSLLGTLFAGTEEEGHSFIQTLTEIITKLDEFLKSADGQTVIDALVFSVKALGLALKVALDTFIFFIDIFNMSMKTLEAIGRGFVSFVTTIGEWLGKIPGWISEFIGTLPEKVSSFFSDMFNRVLTAIGIGIALVLFAIQVLPEKIGKFFQELPQKVYENFLGLVQVVSDIVTMAVDGGKQLLVDGFNGIVDFITSVPDRIRNLIPNFSSAGTSLIESFMNGFRKVGSFIGDIAGDIVGAVKGFLNKAIDKINVGIAKVDEVLPGDMGRIPRLADGALVKRRPGGILANIGEGDEDEVVAPLSKLEGMFQSGQSVVFGPGAISVNFEGAVPTENEARNTGAAVGQGIIAKITQRSARLQVRAI